MDKLPADAAAFVRGSAVAGDAMTNAFEAAELFDVDMDQFAGALALVAANRLDRIERLDTIEAEAPEDAADGRWRDADFRSDLPASPALAAQDFDPLDDGGRRWPVQMTRARAAISETGQPLAAIAHHPFADGPRADACGLCGGLRRLPAQHLHHNPLSTERRQTGILMDVHPVLRGIAEASQLQLPRLGPDGQPIESSHLAQDSPSGKSAPRRPLSPGWASAGPHSSRPSLFCSTGGLMGRPSHKPDAALRRQVEAMAEY